MANFQKAKAVRKKHWFRHMNLSYLVFLRQLRRVNYVNTLVGNSNRLPTLAVCEASSYLQAFDTQTCAAVILTYTRVHRRQASSPWQLHGQFGKRHLSRVLRACYQRRITGTKACAFYYAFTQEQSLKDKKQIW